MSITFWCPDAPTTRVQPYPEDEPDYWEEVSTLPSCNLSYLNGPRLLRQLDLPDECGELELAGIQAVLDKMASQRPGLALSAQLERRISGNGQRQQDLRRWDELHQVFSTALEHQYKVVWG